MRKNFFGVLIPLILLLVLVSSVSAENPLLTLHNTSFSTVDDTPSVWVTYTHSTNATASCVLYMESVARYTNSSVVNNTATALTPSSALGYAPYSTYVTCTTPDTNSNTTSTITVTVKMMDCSGVESTIATILIAIFMIGILVFIVGMVMSGNADAKLLVGAGVVLIIMVIMIGVLNPIFVSICG